MSISSSKRLVSASSDAGMLGEDSSSPTDALSNLTDVMLVFACGLIVALVAHYGVELGQTEDDDMQEMNMQVEQAQDSVAQSSTEYDEVGTVYRNAEDGKLYVVTKNGESLETSE